MSPPPPSAKRFASPARVVPLVATALGCGVVLALAALWGAGTEDLVDWPWVPSVGSRFVLALDGLSAPLALVVAGIAVPVFAYSAGYMPHHLKKEGRPPQAVVPFTLTMLGFMLAMVLLILAHDLLVMFLALEATALASFLLIRFDEDKAEARRAALLALVLTAGSSLLFLAGVLMIAASTGTTVLADLRAEGALADVSSVAVVCLVLGVLAKSAQVPLHMWLPRAMIAPTPVSAYLHSAALVAAGVFVLQRLRFLLETAPPLLDGLFWYAFLSIGVGGLLALVSDEFKRVLAYSTIAQYGYAVALVGAGGDHGVFGAPFFLAAHGLAKCALFMTAGAVTTATGQEKLSESGGLARRMPLLAAASGLAAAGLAGLPLTIGYFKDELLIKAALEHGPLAAALAAAAIAVTLAYTARFWFGIFGGPRRDGADIALGLSLPIAGLAMLVVAGGLWLAPLDRAFAGAAGWIAGTPVPTHLAYDFSPSPTLWLTLAGWGAGILLAWAAIRSGGRLAGPISTWTAWIGPAAWADRIGAGGAALSRQLYRMEVRDMRDRLTAVLVPTGAFVLLGVWARGQWPSAELPGTDALPLAAVLVVVAAAALAAARPLGHVAFVLMLSFVGFGLALAFTLAYAPDVALVLVLVETILTLLLLAVLSQIREPILDKARRRIDTNRGPLTGIVAGLVGALVAWLALSADRPDAMATAYVETTEMAHAKDTVTVILTDFRGLDTAGELTVLAIAIVGAVAIHWGRRP